MRTEPFVLWLLWQNTKTRQRYHIGSLLHKDGKYFFTYMKHGERRTLAEAVQNGYKPHLAFPDVDKTYISNQLFGPFARRLPDKRRQDFDVILKELGLPNDYTEMDLLRATGGRLATDSYEFVSPIYRLDDYFLLDFYIAGWRYYEGEKVLESLKPDDKVTFELQPTNKQDPNAVVVLSNEYGHKLGYIPAIYSGFIYDVISKNGIYEAKIDKINHNAKPQLKVNVSVVGRWETYYDEIKYDGLKPSENLELI